MPIADVGEYVQEHFGGDYEKAVRFALDVVTHMHTPGPKKPAEAELGRTTSGRASGY